MTIREDSIANKFEIEGALMLLDKVMSIVRIYTNHRKKTKIIKYDIAMSYAIRKYGGIEPVPMHVWMFEVESLKPDITLEEIANACTQTMLSWKVEKYKTTISGYVS